MAEYLIQGETLDDIADAINAKTGGSSAMTPAEMVTAIGSISGGGGEPVVATITEDMIIRNVLMTLRTASGNANIYVENITPDPGTGFRLICGAYRPFDSSHVYSTIYRRNENDVYGTTTWSASGTIPAGSVFRVWGLDYA